MYEFLTYIANDMIMPGMIKVVDSFHAPESAIALSLSAYVLGGASLQLILGPLSDAYGRRVVMMVGASWFFASTLMIACSASIEFFLIARFFQGMGLCFIVVIGYATIQELFVEMDAIRLIAMMANVAILAPLLGPLLGAFIISYLNWRFIFAGISFLALITAWGLWRYMPETVGQLKEDGQIIPKISFNGRVIFSNYKALCCNPRFMLGAIARGFLELPCIVWIGLAPIILVTRAHLSVIAYAWWQLPVFGACIIGSFLLRHLTHQYDLERLVRLGTVGVFVSLVLMYALPLCVGNYFIWFMPGLIFYCLSLGFVSAPLNRYILYSTSVTKGITSALMSMISMTIQAVGLEIANLLYQSSSNVMFGLYCALVGFIYTLLLIGLFRLKP